MCTTWVSLLFNSLLIRSNDIFLLHNSTHIPQTAFLIISAPQTLPEICSEQDEMDFLMEALIMRYCFCFMYSMHYIPCTSCLIIWFTQWFPQTQFLDHNWWQGDRFVKTGQGIRATKGLRCWFWDLSLNLSPSLVDLSLLLVIKTRSAPKIQNNVVCTVWFTTQ